MKNKLVYIAGPTCSGKTNLSIVLADIFKDTAMTTLQEQVSADNKNPRSSMPIRGGDRASMTISQNDPTDIFGAEAAGKWAALAFADPVKK